MATSDVICRAIKTRYTLSFTYKGSVRTAEPYILGYEPSGTLVLSSVVETDRKFTGRHPDYNPRDRLFAHVLCQI